MVVAERRAHWRRLVVKLLVLCLLGVVYAPARAQFKLQQSFEDATATGWTLTDSAALTAPFIDPAGSGWLRLTPLATATKGLALNNSYSFASNQPVVVEFNYASWGGTGADGMTVFLYDPTVSSPMSGAATGGGLGYCGGAGGYLAIGLDEYGNFSNPADHCGTASLGPGFEPESLVIRGPETANNAWISTTAVTGGIDAPGVLTRPSPKTVLLTLTPAVSPSTGYTISAQFQSAAGEPYQVLFSNVAFPYAPPAMLAVGLSGGTGGKTNNHDLHGLVTATPDDLAVTATGPSTVLQGAPVTYGVTVTNNGNYPIGSADAPTVVNSVSAAVGGVTWTCVGSGGATCDASGTGNINTSNVTLPVNASVTYTITGTLDPAATCGSTVADTANADFGSSSSFLDPDETNNSPTFDSTVVCNTTLVANPASLTFAPQTVNVASTSQTVTLTEGPNAANISSIAATGDYSQTNNCPASLAAAQTCTINVVFTPSAEGSRTGTLTILSNALASPTVTTQVSLSGTGTNDVPNAFSFTPLNNVALSSVQVSNAITVANTNVPAPISVSSGGQYSINGGPFTSVAGVVSPGAQVQVQVTAAASFSTAVAAVLTIGGVDATFTVTTGTQPLLQGGFTPLTGTAPSSEQISNPITVAGTIAVPITVSSGALYSINGGPFTSAAGVVQPGDQVRMEVTTPATYNTTASAQVTIGGVNYTFTVTTAAQPLLQGDFTPVTDAPPSSVQVSNPITVAGLVAVPISVSSGAAYSINGGPFTTAPGVVQPGSQVRVQVTAPAAFATTATALLVVGVTETKFSVETAQQQQVVVTGGGGGFDTAAVLLLALLVLARAVGLRRASLLIPVTVVVLCALRGAPVWAADDGLWYSNAYAGVRLGGASSSMTGGKLADDLRADGFDVSAADSQRSSFSGSIYAGYELPKNFGVELGYSYLGRTRAALAGYLPNLNLLLEDAAHIVRGSGDIVPLEARYRWDLLPQIAVDLRAGPYVWITKTAVWVNGAQALSRTDDGVGYTLGIGPRFALGRHIGLGISADYFSSTAQSRFIRVSATGEYRF